MSIERVLDIALWAVPAVFITATPIYERLALWRGHDGMSRFVEREGRFLDKDYVRQQELTQPASSGPVSVLQQLGRDARSWSLVFVLYIALTIFAGVTAGNQMRTGVGVILAGVYIWMFVGALRSNTQPSKDALFEATLVTVKPPVFLAFGMATLRLADGRTFETGVRWRPVEARRRRGGSVEVVFSGSADRPMFVGLSA